MTTTTETYAIDDVVYVDNPTITSTVSYTTTEGLVTETQTITSSGTLTLNTTSFVLTAGVVTSTSTRVPIPTHHAICDEDSGNCKPKLARIGRIERNLTHSAQT